MQIIHLVCAKTWGGGEKYALDLCKASQKAGYNVDVFTRGIAVVDKIFKKNNIPVHKTLLNGVIDFISPYRIAKWILNKRDDNIIIHVHNFKDAFTAVRAKKLIGHRKNVAVITTRHISKPASTGHIYNQLYSNIDKIIFVSDFAKRVFLSTNPQVRDEQIPVVHNSIQIPSGNKGESNTKDTESGILNLTFAGRISHEKGIDTLISALALIKMKNLRLAIIGTGEPKYIAYLQDLAKKQNVDNLIDWRGFSDNVLNEFRKSDICIFPSRCKEAFGLTIIEAMSQGKPVISTDNGAQSEIISDRKTGLLIPPENPTALSEAMKVLITDTSKREKMGKEAYNTFISRFSFDKFFERINDIYKSTIIE